MAFVISSSVAPKDEVSAPGMDGVVGLTAAEASARLAQFGPNTLPESRPLSLVSVFLRQFLSPLIYILLAAALVSLVLSDIQDALFIGVVLLLNGIIGTAQEYSAGRAAAALRKLEQPRASGDPRWRTAGDRRARTRSRRSRGAGSWRPGSCRSPSRRQHRSSVRRIAADGRIPAGQEERSWCRRKAG